MTEGKKLCTKCGITKNLSSFYNNKTHKDGKSSHCKKCYCAGRRQAYAENRNNIKEQQRLNKIRYKDVNRKYIWKYLVTHPCVDCGETNIIKLDFDHIEPDKKLFNISTIKWISLEGLKKEIAKCDVRCSNCHRVRTAIQQNSWRVNPEKYFE